LFTPPQITSSNNSFIEFNSSSYNIRCAKPEYTLLTVLNNSNKARELTKSYNIRCCKPQHTMTAAPWRYWWFQPRTAPRATASQTRSQQSLEHHRTLGTQSGMRWPTQHK
jgi:hypothetical protein